MTAQFGGELSAAVTDNKPPTHLGGRMLAVRANHDAEDLAGLPAHGLVRSPIENPLRPIWWIGQCCHPAWSPRDIAPPTVVAYATRVVMRDCNRYEATSARPKVRGCRGVRPPHAMKTRCGARCWGVGRLFGGCPDRRAVERSANGDEIAVRVEVHRGHVYLTPQRRTYRVSRQLAERVSGLARGRWWL